MIILPFSLICMINTVTGILAVCVPPSTESVGFVGIILDSLRFPESRIAILLLCFIIGSIVTNVSLTLLIAGRIIYITRGVDGFCTSSARKMYRTAISATYVYIYFSAFYLVRE
ncbi:hypothetical protein L218DRAFT_589519 [Marasmius fiardii PR-910]|nr:hypothetical protein L218DRAFT_589519 [Marasmius fiardii PR-910]